MICKYDAYLLHGHSLCLPLAAIRSLFQSISFLQFQNFVKVLTLVSFTLCEAYTRTV